MNDHRMIESLRSQIRRVVRKSCGYTDFANSVSMQIYVAMPSSLFIQGQPIAWRAPTPAALAICQCYTLLYSMLHTLSYMLTLHDSISVAICQCYTLYVILETSYMLTPRLFTIFATYFPAKKRMFFL